jgi:phosphomannomutase
VGRDGRSSGPMLSRAITAALTACGRDCVDADVAATPTIGVLVRELGAAGAVQISASHNPPPYNGIKLFGPTGRVLDAITGGAIRDAYFDSQADWAAFDQIGSISVAHDPHEPHLHKVLATVDTAAIVTAKHRVLLDSNHGAGGLLGKRLLQALGCDVVLVGETPDGQFAHVPEPTADNLSGIAELVRQENCVVGFCQDPDADRLALVDGDGRYIGEEYTLALCVQRAMADPATRGPIVINGATSGMSESLAQTVGVTSFRSAVGEAVRGTVVQLTPEWDMCGTVSWGWLRCLTS